MESTHLCPGVNRTGNKQATTSWVAQEINYAESESKKSWEWFLRNLSESFGSEIEHLAFMSDMEKGLAEAIKLIFPNAEHRVCMRHLWKNIKKLFRCEDGIKLQNLVWTASNTYNLNVWHMKLEEIFKISSQVYAYLNSLSCKWSKATFSEHIKNHSNTNNMSESFNAWVEEARNKPVVDLVDMIRAKIMEQRSQRNVISSSWRGQLVPHVEEYIRDITTRKEHFIIRQSTLTKAKVEGLHERHAVDLEKKDCTCGVWQKSGTNWHMRVQYRPYLARRCGLQLVMGRLLQRHFH
ncbi:uncharacterized protein LOC114579560 isoform X2 [Dendrobium catenatum]|uniref:uncharacterized protein LOC114579560 isoform X2 n=1 Tax=Dendrobium catenatum TaxID=906689 RepID=UPI00109FDF66|nr:uncharacterized protein LOC114579560 isoform X2 [Dendrobium catenatum]